MTRLRKHGWRELVLLLAALVCAGTWAADEVRSMRDRTEVAKMTEKMTTICVGRYLIDVPTDASVSLSHERIGGFDVETVDESDAAFHARLEAREADIRARGAVANRNELGGMIEARDLRIAGAVGRTFIYGRERTYGFEQGRRIEVEWASVESHAHIEGLTVSLSMKYGSEAKAREAEALLARVRLRGEGVPSEPGFCVWRALFAEPLPLHKGEHAALHIGFPNHPDVVLAFSSMPGGGTDPDLLTRTTETDAAADPDELLRVAKLRAGKRSINGLAGEEVLERIHELNFATTYAFMWETRGVDDDLLQPFVSLELQGGVSSRPGGKPVDTSLHQDAVVALWDRISSSIRLRPAGPQAGPESDSSQTASKLGTIVTAGETCPQSGWWRCNEGARGLDVQGGQVQYIRKGERMPQALLLPRQTMWQKLRGIQSSVEAGKPMSWKLVDKRYRPRRPALVTLVPAGAPSAAFDGSEPSDVPTALGSYARTGDICSASGWWRCDEANALDGTRWFGRGSVLPPATFQVPTGLFGRSSGPDVIQRRSIWQLVRLAEAEMQTNGLV